jgi:hypothetical protein
MKSVPYDSTAVSSTYMSSSTIGTWARFSNPAGSEVSCGKSLQISRCHYMDLAPGQPSLSAIPLPMVGNGATLAYLDARLSAWRYRSSAGSAPLRTPSD